MYIYATAEIAVALCLAAAKMLVPAHTLLRNNDWSARGIPAEVGKVMIGACIIIGLCRNIWFFAYTE